MALTYVWGFDVALTGSLAVEVDDDWGSISVSITTGTYSLEDLSGATGSGTYESLLSEIETQCNAASTQTHTITFDPATRAVTWSATGGVLTLDFATTAGARLAAILGYTGTPSGTPAVSSVRPQYVIAPAMQGRSNVTDEQEPEGIAEESVADDGTAYMVARATAEVHSDWTQAAEVEAPPATFGDDGTPVFERHATAAVPWSYQHAWRHARQGKQPVLVVDDGTGESAVHELRAEGASFRPQRFASDDYGLWSIPFRTRLLGRL